MSLEAPQTSNLSSLSDSDLIELIDSEQPQSKTTVSAVHKLLKERDLITPEIDEKVTLLLMKKEPQTESQDFIEEPSANAQNLTKITSHEADRLISGFIIAATTIGIISLSSSAFYLTAVPVSTYSLHIVDVIIPPAIMFAGIGLLKSRYVLGWKFLVGVFAYHFTLSLISIFTDTFSEISPIMSIPFLSQIKPVSIFFTVLFSGYCYVLLRKKMLKSMNIGQQTAYILVGCSCGATALWCLF